MAPSPILSPPTQSCLTPHSLAPLDDAGHRRGLLGVDEEQIHTGLRRHLERLGKRFHANRLLLRADEAKQRRPERIQVTRCEACAGTGKLCSKVHGASTVEITKYRNSM